MMFMATTPMGGAPMASALTGAPGAVLLYGLIGAIVWPDVLTRRAPWRPRRAQPRGRRCGW